MKHSAAIDNLQEQLDNSKRVRQTHLHTHSGKHALLLTVCLIQSRQSLEKAKTLLEEERQNLTDEIKSLQSSRTDSERGRKRAESQLQELNARLAQAERDREDREERAHKLQVQFIFNVNPNFFVCSNSCFV